MKFIYAGNRHHALSSINEGVKESLTVYALTNSFLETYCKKEKIKHLTFSNKDDLNELLVAIDEETLFISCGVPFKIDINKYKILSFINIHPSNLPKLRGRDPGIGSILKGEDIAVTIHSMSMRIDSGKILWTSTIIPIEGNMDIKDIYSLSFLLEKEAGKYISKEISDKKTVYNFINEIKAESKVKLLEGSSYFNRPKDYGIYKEYFSNSEFVNHIRCCSLKNYGMEAIIHTKKTNKQLGDAIYLLNASILNDSEGKLKELIYNCTRNKVLPNNLIIYILENRIAIYRNQEIILTTTRGCFNKSYVINNDELIILKEKKYVI